MKRFMALLMSICMVALLMAGCSGGGSIEDGANASDFPVTVGDVTLSAQPGGVAVLSDNLADVVLALGYEIDLKARSESCTQTELKVLPVVTLDDAEQMKSLGVTLVLTEEEPTDDQKAALQNNGITPLVLSTAASRKGLQRLYTEVASVMRGGNTGYLHGEEVAGNILTTLDDINRVIPDSNTVTTACYLYDLEGHVATGDTFCDVLFSCSGVTNAFKGEKGGEIEMDSLMRADPDYIFCSSEVKEQLMSDKNYASLTAVKKKHVVEMDASSVTRMGRTTILTATTFAGTVYPELLETSEESSEEESSQEESSSTENTSSRTLKKGDEGDAVLKLQERLDELGYMFVACSGSYGDATVQAVMDFQLLNGMETTGVADAEMQKVLYSDTAVPRTDG